MLLPLFADVYQVPEESRVLQLQSLTSAETKLGTRRGRSLQLSDFRDQKLLSGKEMKNIWCGGRRNDTSTAFYGAQATSKIRFHVCTLLRVRKTSEHRMAHFPSKSKTPASSKHSYCQPPFVIKHRQKTHGRAATTPPWPAQRTALCQQPRRKVILLN